MLLKLNVAHLHSFLPPVHCFLSQGAQSTPDERGAAAAFAVELDDKHGGRPIQMRIVQGKEPPHFMLIFKGTLIIRQGGVKSAFQHVKKVGPRHSQVEDIVTVVISGEVVFLKLKLSITQFQPISREITVL